MVEQRAGLMWLAPAAGMDGVSLLRTLRFSARPVTQSEEPEDRPMNAVKAALYILTMASGASAGERRNRQLSKVGSGSCCSCS